ncbi:TolC family protein [Mucilaginibacter conchicola]|uniref:TolC family protein n=1 Tax=Mucilaginibacter conchicola TaxID=2303333 RepID=A0A372NWM2_9SPHI|nr:TolC family protein [Mucilaginibacter conchicola]RFZ93037.1 TolC family protein [Mucilaginibacter conchicola]
MLKKSILTILTLLPVLAQAQSAWSLKSCIEYGLKNNRSQAVYANEKRAADAKAKEALAGYLPSISLNGEVDNNIKPQTTVIPAGVFGPEDVRVAFTKKYNTTATAQLDQTIYDQSLITGLKANRYNKEQAVLNQQQNDEAIIYNISSAYYQIFVYHEQLDLLRANQETYRKQIEISRLQVKKGTTLQKDLDKVTVDYNNSLSQTRVAESNLTLAENQLKFEMGYPINNPIQIDSTSANNAIHISNAVLPDTSAFAVGNRVDYRLSVVNSKLLEIDEKRIKSGIFPKLTAFVRYGGVGFADNLGPSFSGMTDYSVVGLKLSFPLFDFFKRDAQYKQAKYKRLNAIENLKLDEGKYQLEYENAKTKLLKEQSNVENNHHNIDLAQSVFKVTDLQYQKGTTDLTDWLNARNSVKEAQNNYVQSLYNFILARIDMEKSAGSLKTFYSSLQ